MDNVDPVILTGSLTNNSIMASVIKVNHALLSCGKLSEMGTSKFFSYLTVDIVFPAIISMIHRSHRFPRYAFLAVRRSKVLSYFLYMPVSGSDSAEYRSLILILSCSDESERRDCMNAVPTILAILSTHRRTTWNSGLWFSTEVIEFIWLVCHR